MWSELRGSVTAVTFAGLDSRFRRGRSARLPRLTQHGGHQVRHHKDVSTAGSSHAQKILLPITVKVLVVKSLARNNAVKLSIWSTFFIVADLFIVVEIHFRLREGTLRRQLFKCLYLNFQWVVEYFQGTSWKWLYLRKTSPRLGANPRPIRDVFLFTNAHLKSLPSNQLKHTHKT